VEKLAREGDRPGFGEASGFHPLRKDMRDVLAGMKPDGCRIVLDPEQRIKEITKRNNTVGIRE
jgi:hypothetical protein